MAPSPTPPQPEPASAAGPSRAAAGRGRLPRAGHPLVGVIACTALLACDGSADGSADTASGPDSDTSSGDTDPDRHTDEPIDSASVDTDPIDSLAELLADTPRFSILAAAITRLGLETTLDGATLLAPDNEAFVAWLETLGAQRIHEISDEQLGVILRYHVVPERLSADDLDARRVVSGTVDALGGTLDLSLDTDGDLGLDGVDIVLEDLDGFETTVHEVDAVLVPNLVDVASTDPSGERFWGIIQVIDGAEGPDGYLLRTALALPGPYTVLLPTNDSVDAMLAGNGVADYAGWVAKEGVENLRDIVSYHAVQASQVLTSDDIRQHTFMPIDSLNGSFAISLLQGDVVFNLGVTTGWPNTNTARFLVTDIAVSNGLIHKIDRVITPADKFFPFHGAPRPISGIGTWTIDPVRPTLPGPVMMGSP